MQPASTVPHSPDGLLLDLPRRKIPDSLRHQREVLRLYAKEFVDEPDVGLQLPTGSGKTLVGLLIGEWRRRRNKERVVYLCPTRQLINQVVEQADEKYGLSVLPFTGSQKTYASSPKAEYRNADGIAVTTYRSLFNTNPFFDDADLLILDDTHAAEDYVAGVWSVRIERKHSEHAALHAALRGILKQVLEPINFARLCGHWQSSFDQYWVDKLPTPQWHRKRYSPARGLDQPRYRLSA